MILRRIWRRASAGHRLPHVVLGALISASMVACAAPKPAPSTPKKAEGSQAAAVPKPVVDHSAAEKVAFGKAAEAYASAKKQGLTSKNCTASAERFADVFEEFPTLVDAKFNEGAVYQECGDLQKATSIYRELLEKHPKHGPTLNNLGEIAYAQGNRDAAVDYFRQAAQAKNSEGYANLALAERDRALHGDVPATREAIDNIHRALAVDSFNIDAYGFLAALVYDHAQTKSELEIARLICVQAIKQDPDYAPVYNVLGLVLLRMGEVTRALRQFRKAVALEPKFKEAHMNIGAITLSFRDYKAAEESFAKVLSLNPAEATKFDATVGLGVAYRGQRRFAEAMAEYDKAQALNPAVGAIAYNKGILLQDYLFDAGNPARGIKQLEQARGELERYIASAKPNESSVMDARRRIKNIDEMLPILREQKQ